MNDRTQRKSYAIPGFQIAPGARAMLVSAAPAGGFTVDAVPSGASLLDIETELTAHLDSMPISTEWLLNLQRYISQRLLAREEAASVGGVSIARGDGWNIVHT